MEYKQNTHDDWNVYAKLVLKKLDEHDELFKDIAGDIKKVEDKITEIKIQFEKRTSLFGIIATIVSMIASFLIKLLT